MHFPSAAAWWGHCLAGPCGVFGVWTAVVAGGQSPLQFSLLPIAPIDEVDLTFSVKTGGSIIFGAFCASFFLCFCPVLPGFVMYYNGPSNQLGAPPTALHSPTLIPYPPTTPSVKRAPFVTPPEDRVTRKKGRKTIDWRERQRAKRRVAE